MNYIEFVLLLEQIQKAAKAAHDKKLELKRPLRLAEEVDICQQFCVGSLVARVDMEKLEVKWAQQSPLREAQERHFEDPPYCWRIGAEVTLNEEGRCPECGWRSE